MAGIPRPEYPRPQFVRSDWINLNGRWMFETDPGKSGRARGLPEKEDLSAEILVPFCPESRLSGIGNTDFMECVWYKRDLLLPDGWLADGRRVLLHIGACDYRTEVWVNGASAGNHAGGYVSFGFDITDRLRSGANRITICAEDDLRAEHQPAGKQSRKFGSEGCYYTRTTGIWQTVWLESVPSSYIVKVKYTPLPEQSVLLIEADCRNAENMILYADASFRGHKTGQARAAVSGKTAALILKLDEMHLWSAGEPQLYDLTLRLGSDKAESYFGMRRIAYDGGKFLLNGKPVFQRLVLDQGFYPDGIYTAPDDGELIADIRRSMDMGFNGARLHQKIFEPRFLYHCDRMGYLVWGEHANWGLDLSKPEAWRGFLPEWLEAVERDYSHPSVIGWCPFNETQKNQDPDLIRMACSLTRTADPTRPVIDTSGWYHVDGAGDLYDFHDYEQDPAVFKARFDALSTRENILCPYTKESCRPSFVSEYGGIWWSEEDKGGWGYGTRPKSREDFIVRYRGLTEALLGNPNIGAFCYTQLTDVEQEQNGLYTYDRKPKFDPETIAAINRQPAAIET